MTQNAHFILNGLMSEMAPVGFPMFAFQQAFSVLFSSVEVVVRMEWIMPSGRDSDR